MTSNIRAIPTTDAKKAEAKAAADAERKRISEEAYAQGIKVGERHKAWAFGLAGVIVGACAMGLYTMATAERGMFAAGAVADRVLGRVVEPAELQVEARPVDPIDAYSYNERLAREPCRRGTRDPRTGLCPGEPPNAER